VPVAYGQRIETLTRDVPTGELHGTYDPAFSAVVDVFVDNYLTHGEIGASACVVHEGEVVVDVWGGTADQKRGQPWESDTLVVTFSCTKGATALCAHLLAARRELDLDAPVSDVWPGFAKHGKERATVRMMLDHSVGVPVFRGPVADGELYDWDRVVGRLEAEEPFWEPGARNGYHMLNFGWTVGELVRLVSGRSLGTFFREEIAEPLGLDFWIGLPEEHEHRVAPIVPYIRSKGEPLNDFAKTLLDDPTSIPALAMTNGMAFEVNRRACHAAEIGGGGGIGNARSLAGMYAPLSLGGGSLVASADVERMRRVSTATNWDATLCMPTRFALGFMMSMDNRAVPLADSVLLGEHAFGHVGMGGSIGFADPSVGLSFGYAMNRQGNGILLNERGQGLVDAAYACLETRDGGSPDRPS
jgi:CubicO group peptidase (beta-lactamase class C family)